MEVKNTVTFLIIFFITVFFYYGFIYLFGGTTILCADTSQDAVFHADLQKDKRYELWVLDLNGPETVEVSISNGLYTPFEGTFRLMHPEGDYLPYRPAFSVKETGGYDIIVHPLDPGTIRIKVQLGT